MAQSVTHTHISVPHNDHTHTHRFHRFGGRNRQTSRGGKLVYSASHSKSEPWLQPIRYPTAATETQRGKKKKKTYVEMMILRDVMESWLPKSILISNGFLFFVQIEALYSVQIVIKV